MPFKYLGVNVSYAIDNLTLLCCIIQIVVKLSNQTILTFKHSLYNIFFQRISYCIVPIIRPC